METSLETDPADCSGIPAFPCLRDLPGDRKPILAPMGRLAKRQHEKRAGAGTRPTDYASDLSSRKGGPVGLSARRRCCQASTSSSTQKTLYPTLTGCGKSGVLVWNCVGESPTISRTCLFDRNRIPESSGEEASRNARVVDMPHGGASVSQQLSEVAFPFLGCRAHFRHVREAVVGGGDAGDDAGGVVDEALDDVRGDTKRGEAG
jgi:hypothetical protein